MIKIKLIPLCFILFAGIINGQSSSFDQLKFLSGKWTGNGEGFGNNKSVINSSFEFIMGGTYLEIKNESQFESTKNNPKGEHHIDKGFISFDTSRKVLVFRQFNIEGYINQYVLNTQKSNDSTLVFETETIENFIPGGKARWTIKKISEDQIETIFDVFFPNKGYSCFGTNYLKKVTQ